MIYTYRVEENYHAIISINADSEADAMIALDAWQEDPACERMLSRWIDHGFEGRVYTLTGVKEEGEADILAGPFTTKINDHPLWYTVPQLAKIFRVNQITVRRWIKNGELKATKKSLKEGYRIGEDSVRRFLSRHPKYYGAKMGGNYASNV